MTTHILKAHHHHLNHHQHFVQVLTQSMLLIVNGINYISQWPHPHSPTHLDVPTTGLQQRTVLTGVRPRPQFEAVRLGTRETSGGQSTGWGGVSVGGAISDGNIEFHFPKLQTHNSK